MYSIKIKIQLDGNILIEYPSDKNQIPLIIMTEIIQKYINKNSLLCTQTLYDISHEYMEFIKPRVKGLNYNWDPDKDSITITWEMMDKGI